jgi:hypothetical protein
MRLKLTKGQREYLEAYGNLWGYNAEWAAMHFLIEAICRSIDKDALRNTRDSFALARQINQSKHAGT